MASLISANFFCPRCRKQRAFLPIDFAALLADVNRRTIYRWMDRGSLHWRTIPDGHRLVCLRSLTEAHAVDAVLLESLLRRGTLPVENG
jgi:hypothetical protein